MVVVTTGRGDSGKSLQEMSEVSSWRKASVEVSAESGYSVASDWQPESEEASEDSLLVTVGTARGTGGKVSEANDCSQRVDGEGAGDRTNDEVDDWDGADD